MSERKSSSTDSNSSSSVANASDSLSVMQSNSDTQSSGFPSWTGPTQVRSNGAFIDPFAPAAANNLRAAAASFTPSNSSSQAGSDEDKSLHKVRILSLNSFKDDGPTIVSSAPSNGAVTIQQPIGRPSAESISPDRKAWFTTDNSHKKPDLGSHFLSIRGFRGKDESSCDLATFILTQYAVKIRGKKIFHHDGSYFDLILFVDDVRTSQDIACNLGHEGSLTIEYVHHEWYIGGEADPRTNFVGQVTFIAKPTGRTSDYDPSFNAKDRVLHHAQSFGSILAFEQNNAAIVPSLEFRVEYHTVTDAEQALQAAGDGIQIEGSKHWILIAKQFVPFGSGISPVRSSYDTTASQAISGNAVVHVSPSGRTAWTPTTHGNVSVAPPNPVANCDRVVLNQALTPYNGNGNGYMPPTPSYTMPLTKHQRGRQLTTQALGKNTQEVTLARIENGQDVRTTIMLRNIPNAWTWRDVKRVLDRSCRHRYNFMYLRIDFRENKNVGYAFINFETSLDIIELIKHHVNTPWDPVSYQSGAGRQKIVEISYATVQGLDALIEKFRNSSVMDELPDYRPILFQTSEERTKELFEANQYVAMGYPPPYVADIGQCKEWPPPNNHAKHERSTANAGLIGLFSPRTRQHHTASQYDRGTPAQIHEDAAHRGMYDPYMVGSPTGPPHHGRATSHHARANGPHNGPARVANYAYATPRAQAGYPPNTTPMDHVYMTAPPAFQMIPYQDTPTAFINHASGNTARFRPMNHGPASPMDCESPNAMVPFINEHGQYMVDEHIPQGYRRQS